MTKGYIAGVAALVGCKVAQVSGDSLDTAASSVEVAVISIAGLHLIHGAIDYCKRVNRAVEAAERTPQTRDITHP
ncbi:hypothetical protein [Streptomyces sp. XY413]|uniref:hypothetical protein n=1 Tax=Streptomyces sp. XY413 TaxID=1519479 RepID=UPI000A8BFFD7|nr:hypothetical protein [Streptomyces sp. XY413]